MLRNTTSGTTSTTSGSTRYHEKLRGTTSGTTRYYEVLRYYEALRGTTSVTASHYEVVRVVLGGTRRYYNLYCELLCGIRINLRYSEWFFRDILPKVVFQKNRYENFTKFSGKQLC